MSGEVVYHAPDRDAYVERHEMPREDYPPIFYKDGRDLHPAQAHSYWTSHKDELSCSGRVSGGSTVSKNDGDTDNDALLNWAVRLAYEGVAGRASHELAQDTLTRRTLAWLTTAASIEEALKAAELLWWQVRDAKGKVGSMSHGVLEALAAGAEPILRTGYDHAAHAWWNARQPEPLHVEQVVHSVEHGYAGRFDLRTVLTGEVVGPHALPDIGGATALVDAKTSGFISNAFHIQLDGYEGAAIECGVGASDVRLILQLCDDGTWKEWAVHSEPGDFLASLDIYNRGKRISSKARADWRAWKQAQEAVAA